MASTESLLQRLALSAAEIKHLTSWPDAMVEDYLNILRDLITLANSIDSGAQSAVIAALFPWILINEDHVLPQFMRPVDENVIARFKTPPATSQFFSVAANHTTRGDESVEVTSNITVFLNPDPEIAERVTVKRNTGAGAVTIDGNGRNIDGAATTTQNTNYDFNTFLYSPDSDQWLIVGG